MNVKVIREAPVRPPVTDVILYLSSDEAARLMDFAGRLSPNTIRECYRQRDVDDKIESTYRLTAQIYDEIKHGLSDAG